MGQREVRALAPVGGGCHAGFGRCRSRIVAADADAFVRKLAGRPRLVLETIKRYQAKAAHLTPDMASEYAGTLLALVRS